MLLTIILVTIAIAAFIAGAAWWHHATHRAQALEYEGVSRVPPPSTVCPHCHRRSYSRRAVTELYCESCDTHYGQRQAA